jgi:ABC-type bacteriocin/lantibiotic exporter with double-glycine peptidase domain
LAVKVFASELRRQKRLTWAVLIVTALDAGVTFGLSPLLVARFAERISAGADRQLFGDITYAVACVALAHVTLFFLKVRWRRRLTERGRLALSNAVERAFRYSSVETHRRSEKLDSATQKIQECWIELTHSATELYLPFIFGTLTLFCVVGVQVPSLALPLAMLLGLGGFVAWMSGRHFTAKNREMSIADTRERDLFEAMLAVLSMKWLLAKLTTERSRASERYSSIFREQAQINVRWQSLLLVPG